MTAEARRLLALGVGITLAAAQGALLVAIWSGRLEPAADAFDVPWFTVWFVYTVAGAIVLERVAASVVGWLLCLVGSIPAAAVLLELVGAERVSGTLHLVIPPLLLVALPAAFPDGVVSSPKRLLGFWGALVMAVLSLGTAWLPAPAADAASGVALAGSGLGGVAVLAGHVRFVRTATQPRRTQHTIFLGGFAAAVLVMLLGAAGSLLPGENPSGEWIQLLGLACLPVGVVVAMVGTGLWGTDLAHGRRILHVGVVALTATLLGVALLMVVAGLVATPGLAAAAAIGGAAAGIGACWWIWRRLARRLYGAEPSGAWTEADPDDATALVAAALRSPGAAITTRPDDAPHGGIVLALGADRWLVVQPRRPGESFTRRDRRVAERMASGIAAQLERSELRRGRDAAQAALRAQRHREQQRLRAALHDTVGPLLIGAEMQARALRNEAPSPETEDLHEALRQAREAMREILDEGSPRALASGLVPALEGLCRRWSEPPVTLEDHLDPAAVFDAATAQAAYLIVAEALANVSQHAAATACTVRLSATAGRLVAEVIDDGSGIDPTVVPGIGLASMRGRALEMGGDIVVSPSTHGTIVTVMLPLRGTGEER